MCLHVLDGDVVHVRPAVCVASFDVRWKAVDVGNHGRSANAVWCKR